jgi:lysyl-tRNA synthetase class 2
MQHEFSDPEELLSRMEGAIASMGSVKREEEPWVQPERQKRLTFLRAAFSEIVAEQRKGRNIGATIANLFEAVAEEHLTQPTIIYEFPTAVSPLSKQKPDEPDWTERWEIFAGKMEIANGFSELNDPEDQRRRFEQQIKERERGDEEAHQMDEDYIRALSYGMPPAGGVGVGVDRFAMLLTNSHTIRDVILFPLLRSEKKAAEDTDGK